MDEKTCFVCGAPLPPGCSKFCSAECRNRIYQSHAINGQPKCPVCKRPVDKIGDFCSRGCVEQRQRDHYGATIRELLRKERAAKKGSAA